MQVDVIPIKHQGSEQLALRFGYNEALISVAKQLGCQWSQSNKCWYIPNKENNLKKIFAAYKGKAWVDATALYNGRKPNEKEQKPSSIKANRTKRPTLQHVELPQAYLAKLKSRRYSTATISTYTSLFKAFLQYFAPKPPEEITEQEIKAYLLKTVEERGLSDSTQNQIINSIQPVGSLQ